MSDFHRQVSCGVCLLAMWVTMPFDAFAGDGKKPVADSAEVQPENKVGEFMRSKLDSAQNILEGLTVEDFKLIEKGCDNLIVMSKAAEWQVIHGPVYAQDSAEFRQAASQLKKMAETKSLDGAVLAYLRVTMSCVNCHKHVRAAKVAGLNAVPLERFTQALPSVSAVSASSRASLQPSAGPADTGTPVGSVSVGEASLGAE